MEITYTKNNIAKFIGKDSDSSVITELYSHFDHTSHLIEQNFGVYYYKFKAKSNHVLEASYSDSYIKLVICLSGHATNNFNSKNAYAFQENNTLFYKTQQGRHSSRISADKEIELVHIHVPVVLIEKYLGQCNLLEALSKGNKITRPTSAFNKQIFYQLNQSSYNPGLQKLFIEKLILDHLFYFLNDTVSYSFGKEFKIDNIEHAKSILDSSEDFITITNLAKKVGLNEFILKSEFKKRFNTTIYQYQRDRKFDLAYLLLNESNLKIDDIMEGCGYTSLGTFSNSFFKKYGLRPSELKKS